MSGEITESDWKIWKALRLRTIDKFCHQTFDQVQQLAKDQTAVHERHRKLYQLVTDRDQEIEQLFDPMKRSIAPLQLMNLYRIGLISDDDISLFSESLQSICHQTKAF